MNTKSFYGKDNFETPICTLQNGGETDSVLLSYCIEERNSQAILSGCMHIHKQMT